jgi:hypothetical protein
VRRPWPLRHWIIIIIIIIIINVDRDACMFVQYGFQKDRCYDVTRNIGNPAQLGVQLLKELWNKQDVVVLSLL